MNRGLVLAAACLLSGCGGANAASGGDPVVSMDAWEIVAEADDPFNGRRANWHYCDPSGISVESSQGGPALEVDTGSCNFATVRQPTAVPLQASDALELTLWHGPLDAPEAASATIVVATDGQTLLQGVFPIPSASAQVALTGAVGAAIAAGTPVYLHLNNHGDNAWTFLSLEKR